MSDRIFIYGSFLLASVVFFTYPASGEELQTPPDPAATTAAGELTQPVVSPPITRTKSALELGPQSFLRTFADDQKHIWTSPSRILGADWKWIVPITIGTGVAIATDNRLNEELPNPDDPAKIAGKHVSQFGALYTVAGISAGTYLLGRIAGKDRLRDTGWLGLEAVAHTQVVVQGLKLVTQRERPPDPKPRRGFWNGGSSFPSGHAGTTWAWATVVARQYPEKKIVPAAVYSLAAVVSAARLSARRHYASDILVGGAIGHLIGRYLHQSQTAASSNSNRAALLTPRVGVRYSRPVRHYALNLSWAF